MKLFDRTPTGRVKRSRYNRGSYSKTDKPFSLKLKSALSARRTQIIIAMGCLIVAIFLFTSIFFPSSSNSNNTGSLKVDALPNNASISFDNIVATLRGQSHEKLSKSLAHLLEKMKKNPNQVDIDHIEQLLSHRSDLESYLNGIDDVLLQHKDKISDVLPFVPVVGGKGSDKAEEEQEEKTEPKQRKSTKSKKRESRLKQKIIAGDGDDATKRDKKKTKSEHSEDRKVKKMKELESKLAKKTPKKEKENMNKDKSQSEQLSKSPSEIRLEIIDEMKYAYNCYKKCAWGFDTVHPMSCTGTNDAFDLGLAMIDALDTLIIMNMGDPDIDIENDLNDIKEWVTNKMRFNQKNEVSLFESTIRVLGGLLAAYHLTNHTYDHYQFFIYRVFYIVILALFI